jgi:hypothetical protein
MPLRCYMLKNPSVLSTDWNLNSSIIQGLKSLKRVNCHVVCPKLALKMSFTMIQKRTRDSYFCLFIFIFRPCILIVVYVYLLLSMYYYCSSMYSYRCLRILIVVYVFLFFVHVFLSLSTYTYCCLCIL